MKKQFFVNFQNVKKNVNCDLFKTLLITTNLIYFQCHIWHH